MAQTYHTPIEWWLDQPVVELFDWVMIAKNMLEEQRAKQNVQEIRPPTL